VLIPNRNNRIDSSATTAVKFCYEFIGSHDKCRHPPHLVSRAAPLKALRLPSSVVATMCTPFNSVQELLLQILPMAYANMAVTVCGGDAHGFTEKEYRDAVVSRDATRPPAQAS
jgi:hypothetical protein